MGPLSWLTHSRHSQKGQKNINVKTAFGVKALQNPWTKRRGTRMQVHTESLPSHGSCPVHAIAHQRKTGHVVMAHNGGFHRCNRNNGSDERKWDAFLLWLFYSTILDAHDALLDVQNTTLWRVMIGIQHDDNDHDQPCPLPAIIN